MISSRTRTVIITVVTIVWSANFVGGIAIPDYEPRESINGIFMVIVGSLFALGSREKDPSEGSSPPPKEVAGE